RKEPTSNTPLFVLRYWPATENKRVVVVIPSSRVCNGPPATASQSLTVLSHEPDATSLPSGENATDVTQRKWPSSVCSGAPVTASQSLTVWSHEPDATSLPSGENATDVTRCEWPSSVCSGAPVTVSQSLTVWS